MDLVAEYKKMVRVLRVATRPRQKEFEHMAKVTFAGTIIIGAIGVIIAAVFSVFDKL
ncbi:MAG: protein translocase SEC61 complex subunit gamma [Candidatus Micrarchaeia archaeon]